MPDRVSSCILLLTLLMFLLALTPVTDLEGIAAQSTTVVSEPEKQGMLHAGTPHDLIDIDGDADFAATALAEGWPGDGSPENPFIINGLDIDLGGEYGPCISIWNTRVSFTISNCRLTDAGGSFGGPTGIVLSDVTSGELVDNIVDSNAQGICLLRSNSTTVANNTCINNDIGICLEYGCNSNTVVNNTCNSNRVGIYLLNSLENTVVNNTLLDNTKSGIIWIIEPEEPEAEEFGPLVLLLIGLSGITLLGAGYARWRKLFASGDPDEIIVPTRYRLVSWFRKRRALKNVDVDETLEPDSSE